MRSPVAERRAAGYRDMTAALAEQPWIRQEVPAHLAAMVHRVVRGAVTTRPEPNLRTMGSHMSGSREDQHAAEIAVTPLAVLPGAS